MFGGNGSTTLDLNAPPNSVGFDTNAHFTVPAEILFHGEYKRAGNDLKIVDEHGKTFVVHDYFKTDDLHTLFAPDGAALTGAIVAALAGPLAPGEYAQTTPPQGNAQPIGRVATVQGTAVAVRNGVAISLNLGDAVLKDDVVQTQGGSAVGIILGDGSTFNLGANARMMLNDYVYNPASTSGNSAFINLVSGSITFLAGQVAHTGGMQVGTPVATMGIRGTAVQVDIDVNLGTTKVSVLFEPALGRAGSFEMYSLSGQLLGSVNDYHGQWTITPSGALEALVTETQKTPDQLAQALSAVQSAFQTQQLGQAILQQQPVPPSPPQNQHPTQATPGTQIASTDLSSTHIKIDATETPTTTTVVVKEIPAGGNAPPTVPLALPPPPPPPAANSPVVLGGDTVKAAIGWTFDADNGHYYRFVSSLQITWNEAANAAAADGAYLATITSASENAFVHNLDTSGNAWLGGSDAAQEGTWVWVMGPEAGTVFYVNSPQSFLGYSNWKFGEPNNLDEGPGTPRQENYLQFLANGQWNDEQGPNFQAGDGTAGFVEEKSVAPGVVLASFVKNEATLISTAALLANDTDTNGFPLDVTAVAGTSAHGGTLALNNGVITYTPFADYTGYDQFTYTVSDGHGGVATGLLTFTVLSDLSQVVADPPLVGVSASDSITITPQQTNSLGTIATNADSNGGVDWHFDATPTQLNQLAGQTQYYTVQDLTHPTANQAISVSVGGESKDQFVFDMNTNGAGTHAIVNFSTATVNGAYVGDTIELDNFTNAQNAPLQLADVLVHLTQDAHGNAVVDLGHGDSIAFQGISAGVVQAHADQIFAFHQQALV
jgi:hypothetical protein